MVFKNCMLRCIEILFQLSTRRNKNNGTIKNGIYAWMLKRTTTGVVAIHVAIWGYTSLDKQQTQLATPF